MRIGQNQFKLLLRTANEASLKLRFWEVGADFDEKLEVETTSTGLIDDGCILLSSKSGLNQLNVTFVRNVLGGIKLTGSTEQK